MAGSLSIEVFNSGYKPIPGGPGWDNSTPATWPASTSTLVSGDRDAVLVDALLTTSEGARLAACAAFAPDEGETLGDAENGSKDSVLGTALVQYHYPAGPGGQTAIEFAVNPALLREAFAGDLPAETTALMAATQRPAAAAAFTDASGPPAWKTLPSWAVVATGDKAAGTDVIRSQAQRAGADIVEVEGSHVIMISQPQVVTDHILKAARAVAGSHP
jgi:Alpha/beta hydrolase family